MIEERIRKIEARIHGTEKLPAETKEELFALLESLRKEIAELPESHASRREHVRSAEASNHGATPGEHEPQLLETAMDDLRATVEEFEVTHPKLTDTVNRIAMILSNMGM